MNEADQTMNDEILCYGEVLWDALPAGLFLGGAPFNVAVHLHQLGLPVSFASRIGDDELGREIVRRLERRGVTTDLVQEDPGLATGFVIVSLDEAGSPTFDIVQPSAWDAIAAETALLERAKNARAIVYGSLAQRQETSRDTLKELLEFDLLRVFDVNLRPPFDTRSIVEESLHGAHIVKLNDDEIRQLAAWFALPDGLQESSRALARETGCETVCVTRGPHGAALLHRDEWYEHPGYSVEAADCVGSGDAFLAGLLSGLLEDQDAGETLAYANALGAYVATQNGATPGHDSDAICSLRQSA